MSYKPSGEVKRFKDRDEWEVMLDDTEGAFFHVGLGESAKVLDRKQGKVLTNAAEVARDYDVAVRLYHTHPSPGPVRRYCGKVLPDGTFVDGRR